MPPIAVNAIDVDDADDVCHAESGTQNDIPLLDKESSNTNPIKSARDGPTGDNKQALSIKQSDRYSARDSSARGNNMLCESEGSVLMIDDSGVIGDIITPDILTKKAGNVKKLNKKDEFSATTGDKRGSFNRGAF